MWLPNVFAEGREESVKSLPSVATAIDSFHSYLAHITFHCISNHM